MKHRRFPFVAVVLVWGMVSIACGLPTKIAPTVTTTSQHPQPDPEVIVATETVQPAVTADPEPATSTPTTNPNAAKVNYQGVSFTYDLSLANSVSAKIAPVEPGEAGQIGWIGPVPETYEFSFDGYVLKETYHQPKILVYPIQDFASINEPAGEIADDLESLLVEFNPNLESMPFLPLWNAGQVFFALPQEIYFMNGRGVSYLTCYAQAMIPIDQECLFYTFQGTTYDKQYYIVGILPVGHPDLESAENTAQFDEAMNSADGKLYETYVKNIRTEIENWDPKTFSPSLTQLDALMNSLSVQPTIKLKSPEVTAPIDCPNALAPRLRVGDLARVTFTDGKALRVRNEPGKNATVLGQLPEGAEMTINGGPVCEGDGIWWEMTSADGKLSGWVLEGEDGSYFIEPWQ